MEFEDQLQVVIGTVEHAVARAEKVADVRRREGKRMSDARRAQLVKLESALDRLRDVLSQDDETAEIDAALMRHEVAEKRKRGERLTDAEQKVWREVCGEAIDRTNRPRR